MVAEMILGVHPASAITSEYRFILQNAENKAEQ